MNTKIRHAATVAVVIGGLVLAGQAAPASSAVLSQGPSTTAVAKAADRVDATGVSSTSSSAIAADSGSGSAAAATSTDSSAATTSTTDIGTAATLVSPRTAVDQSSSAKVSSALATAQAITRADGQSRAAKVARTVIPPLSADSLLGGDGSTTTGGSTGTGTGTTTGGTTGGTTTGFADPSADSSAMPVGSVTTNGRTWNQTYSQDFTTPAALGSFSKVYPSMATYSGFKDTSGQGLYSPDKVLSVSNGNLDFWMHSENGQPLVATVMPDDYAPHVTGRVSIRFKADSTPGYKFVGMFWPSDDNWNEGEIDWPESDLGAIPRPASAVPGSFENGNMKFMPATEMFADSTTGATYHTATTEWDKNAVRFYWDGQLVSTVTNAVPTTAMRVTLQAETWIGEGAVPTSASGHLDIDWISIWD